MGHSSVKKTAAPKDPDPTPREQDGVEAEMAAARDEKRRVRGYYGRARTILAGNTEAEAAKKTILGG
jgi:hypothetical protein